MNQNRIVALAVLSGVPVMLALAGWLYLQGNLIVAAALGLAALADAGIGLLFLIKNG